MSAIDTAKEIVRITSTAGLSKDVIDLLEKKNALLAEQIIALETENANLKEKVERLEQELDHLSPKSDRLEEGAEKLLELLFQRDMTPSSATRATGASQGMVEYHQGVLIKRRFARWEGISIVTDWGESEASMAITQDGRAYCVRHGLAK
jgi:hypothetical protein